MNKSKVFVINKGGHDFTEATNFGDIVYLSEGSLNRYAVTNMYRKFAPGISSSKPNDYILITGLTTMACIACAMFAHMHGRLNLLLFKSGRYIERTLVLEELLLKKPFTKLEEAEDVYRVAKILEELNISDDLLKTHLAGRVNEE